MARLSYRAGSYAESASYYRRLLEVRPDAEAARRLGAILLERLGDEAGAREAFGRALELMAPDDPRRPAIEDVVGSLGG